MARHDKSARTSRGEKRRPARLASREAEPTAPKQKGGKTRSLAAKLSAEVDALRAQLMAERSRTMELETRVGEDPLTGLLNRRGFVQALERALAYVKRYSATASLLFLDLDGFKPVNDRHGHAAGDWVLGRVGRMLAGSVRASDVVARVGGDEFVVLLWNLNETQAGLKARSLEQTIETSDFEFSGKRFEISLSAGLTMLEAGDTVTSALARADQAMYARKRERKSNA